MTEKAIKKIKGAEFATRFALQPEKYAWLLGAGSSASANIPTGYMMITDFKTQIFCRETNLSPKEIDSTDPLWVARINEFFSKRIILPPLNDPSEYSAAFQAVYSTESDRRQYIENAIRKGTPSFGHRVLASLITMKRIPCVFTTNFDPLIETAVVQTDQLLEYQDRAMPVVAAIDSAERADRCMKESRWPLIAKLHGDYQSTKLKNTEEELATQDEKMRAVFSKACSSFGLIVLGYSGRDSSVMEVLETALDTPEAFPGGIYWISRPGSSLFPAVTKVLEKASSQGIETAIIESENFDEFSSDLINQFELPNGLHEHVFEARPTPILQVVSLPDNDALRFPILRCSALLISQIPTKARRFVLSKSATTERVRALFRENNVYALAACNGKTVAAFGADKEILSALGSLGAKLDGTIELKPDKDSWAHGLIYDALIKALCRNRPLSPRLRYRGHAILIRKEKNGEDEKRKKERQELLSGLQRAYSTTLNGKVPKLGYFFSEGIRIKVEQLNERWWCVFEPFTFVDLPREDVPDKNTMLHRSNPVDDWRRERWAQRYNSVWAKVIEEWAKILSLSSDGKIHAFEIQDDIGIDAKFCLTGATAWSRPGHLHDYFTRDR